MRTTADLNRIIDKIAENAPARFDASTPQRADVSEIPRSTERRSSETPPVAKEQRVADEDAAPESRPFAPRLAPDSDSLATPTPRSALTRRRTPDALNSRRPDSSRASDERAKKEKNDQIAQSSNVNAKKFAAQEPDEEARRTQRRRQIDPTTCERDYSTDEIEFMKALDDYKRASGRMFPTCSEILEVFKSLGYVKKARADSNDKSPQRNPQANRAATPAFLNDEENDAFNFEETPVLEIA